MLWPLNQVILRFALDALSVEDSLLKIVNVVSVGVHVFTLDACIDLPHLYLVEADMIVFVFVFDNRELALHCIDLRLDIGTCELQLSLEDYSISLLGNGGYLLDWPGLRQYFFDVALSYLIE